ncbi:hypothetical protein [Flavobacterium hercynium]|uniref:Lysozyme inhibitor LprI N-terminal domain-containing protein n=1 Tax=Flavobacterium hercynium TaxID=387094 RepID=A0A226GW11_9FLAO|nr:hypothetical protein [Flavobacterium hercynium]OXA85894.1 hypothetical protein B0A66_18725 [Flavobacterium hercynium]SMP33737.1 hypothetical protein SAMN06265346_11731 [Flavobacterium hercynium]
MKAFNLSLMFILLLINSCTYSQGTKSKKLDYMKKFALENCIYNNYNKIDSTFFSKYRDVSAVALSSYGELTELEQNKIREFTKSKTSSFYSNGNTFHFENGKTNIVICECLLFYDSKELLAFLKKI